MLSKNLYFYTIIVLGFYFQILITPYFSIVTSETWLCHVSGGYTVSLIDAHHGALVEVYTAVCSLSKILDISFSFAKAVGRQRTTSFPEVQLMALVVIAIKLYHPFDELKRYVETLEEPGILTVDWDVWCEEHVKYQRRETLGGKLSCGNAIKVKEQDVFAMSEQEIDEYLDWYEMTWVKDGNQGGNKTSLLTDLLDMFPTGGVDDSPAPTVKVNQAVKADKEALVSKLEAVQACLKFRGFVSEESQRRSDVPVRRLGNFYKRYRKEEEIPPQAKMFFEAAADLVGISLQRMMLAVFQTEQKLLKYREKQARESQEMGSDSDFEEAPKVDGEAMNVVSSDDGGDSLSANSDVGTPSSSHS